MESLNNITNLLEGKIVLGSKEEICPNLFIIPVYKVKISFLNLKTDLKENIGDGASGSINVTPICLLKVYNNNLDVVSLNNNKDSFSEIIPNFLSNIDINDIFRSIKLS